MGLRVEISILVVPKKRRIAKEKKNGGRQKQKCNLGPSALIAGINNYHKIPKISPSKYKPPQTGNAKNPPLNRPSKYKPPGGLYLEHCPQIQSKNGKFTSIYKASPIDFETHLFLRR